MPHRRCSRWDQFGRRVAGSLVLGGLGIAAASVATAYLTVHPLMRWRGSLPPGVERELVRFPNADGLELAGWYRIGPNPRATIIVCHGWPGDMSQVLDIASALFEAGFDVLTFDFRNWGRSAPGPVTLGYREAQDVIGAVRFLQEQRVPAARQLGVVGVSMGAAAAILAASQTAEIQAVVADSCYARLDEEVRRHVARRLWGPLAPAVYETTRQVIERLLGFPLACVSPEDAIAYLAPRPVLIIHGTRDRMVNVSDAHALYRSAGAPKALWLVEGARHARARRARPAEYSQRLVDFFTYAFARRRS